MQSFEVSAPPGEAVVIGIDIGGTKTAIALAGLRGSMIQQVRIDTRPQDGPGQTLSRIAETVAKLISAAGSDRPVAVGAVSPGAIQTDGIRLAPNLPGWQDIALAAELVDRLGISQVAVMNDVQAGALAELRYGALRDSNPGIYVNIGTGLAAALVIDGRVVLGAHGAAGEIGYQRDRGQLGKGAFGDHADLEDLIGGRALGRRAEATLGLAVDAAELFGLGDPVARHLIHQGLGALGSTLATLAAFTDPQLIVIGGGLMASVEEILPVITALVNESVPFPPTVVQARFLTDASLYGAIALAADAATARQGVTA